MAAFPESDTGEDEPDEEKPVAGAIVPIGSRRAVFLPDTDAPAVDREALQKLLSGAAMSPAEKERVVFLASHYHAWYAALRELMGEAARRELESGD